MSLEEKFYKIKLYDIYYELFTKKQQEIFEMHYDDDLSVSEIAGKLDISSAAVSKTIKQVSNKLSYYEGVLHINSTYRANCKMLEQLGVDKKIINKIK